MESNILLLTKNAKTTQKGNDAGLSCWIKQPPEIGALLSQATHHLAIYLMLGLST